MKFKGKDGNVFEDIDTAADAFCVSVDGCQQCPIGRQIKPQKSCVDWCEKNPTEAACLMGYEVVVEELTCDTCMHNPPSSFGGKPCSVCGPNEPALNSYQKKETDMAKQKPRICEVLGVEVGERFKVYGNWMNWHIDENGCIISDSGNRCVDNVIYIAINRPDKIIRQPRTEEKEEPMKQDKPFNEWTLGEVKGLCEKSHCDGCLFGVRHGDCKLDIAPASWNLTDPACFTEEEMADARVLERALLADGLRRNEIGDIFTTSSQAATVLLDSRMFPSILPGQSVRLSEIAGEVTNEG